MMLIPTASRISGARLTFDACIAFLVCVSIACGMMASPIVWTITVNDGRTDLLANFATRYIWWRSEPGPSDDRVIAQVINIGTYDDIRRLEAAFSPEELRGVMLRAAPGWISDRSWSFFRGRLLNRGVGPIPEEPARRNFDAAVF